LFNQYREEKISTKQSKVLERELAEQRSLKDNVKGVDLRDIMKLFDDYMTTEKSILNRL